MNAEPAPQPGIADTIRLILLARHRRHLTPVEAAVRAEHLLFVDACHIRAQLRLPAGRWPERRRLLRNQRHVQEAEKELVLA